jgi:hypothetical protein
LKNMTAGLGLSGDFHYAVPSDGFTLGQYVLAHGVGGSPVAPAIRYHEGNQLSLRPGEIIEVSLDPSTARPAATINSLIDQLRQRRLRALTLGALMRGAARSHSPSA